MDTQKPAYIQAEEQNSQERAAVLQKVLIGHLGVQDAFVREGKDEQGKTTFFASIVPSAEAAFPVLQLLRLRKLDAFSQLQTTELPNGMVIAEHNQFETESLYKEIFEKRVYARHDIRLPDSACIIDVGANIGLGSLFFSQHCKNPSIYAFEPGPSIYALLKMNVSLYGLNAQIFNYALSKESGTRMFTAYTFCSPMSGFFSDAEEGKAVIKDMLVAEYLQGQEDDFVPTEMIEQMLVAALTNEQIPCRMETLSYVIEEQGLEVIDLLKLDAEKSEMDILEGIKEEHWSKIKQIVMEVHGSEAFLQEIVQLLEQHEYALIIEKDPIFKRSGLYELYAYQRGTSAERAGKSLEESQPASSYRWSSAARLIEDIRAMADVQSLTDPSTLEIVVVEQLPGQQNGSVDQDSLSL